MTDPAGQADPQQPSSRPGERSEPQAEPEVPAGYVLANPYLPPTTTGFGAGGLATGIGSCVLGLLSCCWWPLAALPVVMGFAAMGLGYLGMKQVDDSGGEVTGKSTAIWAMATGAGGLALTVVSLVAGLIMEASIGSAF
ncbi:MAG: hypothetical protein ACRDOV_00315 [Streptomyces sp.]